MGLVAIGTDAVVSKDVAERALLAASPPRLTPGSSTRVKKLSAQTQTLPKADLINSRDGGFEREIEPQLVPGLFHSRVRSPKVKAIADLIRFLALAQQKYIC